MSQLTHPAAVCIGYTTVDKNGRWIHIDVESSRDLHHSCCTSESLRIIVQKEAQKFKPGVTANMIKDTSTDPSQPRPSWRGRANWTRKARTVWIAWA
jgi:hypothetical protein